MAIKLKNKSFTLINFYHAFQVVTQIAVRFSFATLMMMAGLDYEIVAMIAVALQLYLHHHCYQLLYLSYRMKNHYARTADMTQLVCKIREC